MESIQTRTVACRNPKGPPEGLVDHLVEEMCQAWHQHERHQAEEYLERTPDLARQPEAAIRLIYEEICLRREAGEEIVEGEYLQRFPQWHKQLRPLLGSKKASSQTPSYTTPLPVLGENFGEFVLLEELGHGAEGRVYLAQQKDLADRLVVLKVTGCAGGEHFSLARLQHTHIVPLYSVHEDTQRDLRVLCMPYFGRATLKHLLEILEKIPVDKRQGWDVLAALDKVHQGGALANRVDTPARKFLAGATYQEAVCWLGSCLAEALQFAHERGLVHLDLKPSNILLGVDGQPMLLDFHLARPPLRVGETPPAWMGGSLGYMSPEQHQVMMDVMEKRVLTREVDGRSDLYSLGMFLFEALTGYSPAALRPPVPLARDINPQVSVGLADIVHKCLAPRPEDRYSSAAALGADLRCQLENRPLRGVANRSPMERWHKWRRRKPFALPILVLFLALLGAGVAAASLGWNHLAQRQQMAENALFDGQNLIRKGQFTQAIEVLARGVEIGDSRETLQQALTYHLELARRAHKAKELRELADHVRSLLVLKGQSLRVEYILDAACRHAWQQRSDLWPAGEVKLELAEEKRIPQDLLDVALAWAELRVRLNQEGRPQALAILNEAGAFLNAQPILARERQVLTGEVNPEEKFVPATAWEHCLLGRTLLREGRLEQAAEELQKSLALEPQSFWANFYRGVCASRQQDWQEAVVAFSVCIGQNPASAESLVQRGRAFAALGNQGRALGDCQKALQIQPNHPEGTELVQQLGPRP